MRAHDWPEKLCDFIAGRERVAFRWGRYAHDCFSFAAACVVAQGGPDMAADLAEYVSADEADVLLTEIGMQAHIDKHLTRRESPSFAQRGDVALVNTDHGETLFIVEGEHLVGAGRRRLERIPRARAEIVWAV